MVRGPRRARAGGASSTARFPARPVARRPGPARARRRLGSRGRRPDDLRRRRDGRPDVLLRESRVPGARPRGGGRLPAGRSTSASATIFEMRLLREKPARLEDVGRRFWRSAANGRASSRRGSRRTARLLGARRARRRLTNKGKETNHETVLLTTALMFGIGIGGGAWVSAQTAPAPKAGEAAAAQRDPRGGMAAPGRRCGRGQDGRRNGDDGRRHGHDGRRACARWAMVRRRHARSRSRTSTRA